MLPRLKNDLDINCEGPTSKKNEENKYNHEIKLLMDSCTFMQVRLFRRNSLLSINQHHTFLLALKFHGKNAYLMDCKILHCTAWLLGQADVSEVN